jgi:ABC-type lipoprotein release transport system permease subunit
MSVNFALKDLYHFGTQTKTYLRAGIAVLATTFFFLNLSRSIGILEFSTPIRQYTYTMMDIFTQYNLFLIILTFLLAASVMFSLNHALIMHRKQDIAVMQSLGTYPTRVYNFYMTEIFLMNAITNFFGWILGFGAYVITVMVLEGKLPNLVWNPDFLYTIILIVVTFAVAYLVNGYEIRKIGRSLYTTTKMGKVDIHLHARLGSRAKAFLASRSLGLKLAIQNLARLRVEFRQTVLLIAMAGAVALTGIIGALTVFSTSQGYLTQGQGNHVYAIGAQPILDSVASGFEKFADPTLPNMTVGEFADPSYNLTAFIETLQPTLNQYQINRWEDRLYTVYTIEETTGYYINSTGSINEIFGDNETKVLPFQGIHFESNLLSWYYLGELPTLSGFAVVGDTLGMEMFEEPIYQRFSFRNTDLGITFYYQIKALAVDPFNNGNTAYISLADMQECTGLPNYTNLIYIDATPAFENGHGAEFYTELSALVHTVLGDQFGVLNLEPILRQNTAAITGIQTSTFVISGFMGAIIIFVLINFQTRRIDEEQRDLYIIRAVGGTERLVRSKIFNEQAIMVGIGLSIGLMLSLFAIEFTLMKDQILPPLYLPLAVFGGMLGILWGFAAIIAAVLARKNVKNLLAAEIRV